ncbi:MAG: MmgE/PrpD family protein [Pseudomonadota bacterium]
MTEYGVAPLELGLTTKLCEFLAPTRHEDLPAPIQHEVKRALLDWIGCTMAGSGHPTIEKLTTVFSTTGGTGQATVVAKNKTLGMLEAPIANGQMGHILDFDDTHMDGVVLHASSPLFSALFALSEHKKLSGREIGAAFTAGFEAAVRVGKSAPRHHDGGWHLTGTLGTIGAAIAAGRALGLSALQMTHCSGVATTQAAGMQQNRGTMCKSFHSGKAASNGLLAALLAAQGFDSSPEIFEGRKGFARIYSTEANPDALTTALGERWELGSNGYKPYACGIVQHPLIDAMVSLAATHSVTLDQIEAFEAKVNEAAVRITGVEEPETGLKSKFSLKHSAAVGYLDGDAGIIQYSDARATAEDVRALRRRIHVTIEDGFRRDEAEATLVLASGARHTVHVPHASGTAANPMSDAKLEAKFRANTEPVVGKERAERIAQLAWALDDLEDFSEFVRACS